MKIQTSHLAIAITLLVQSADALHPFKGRGLGGEIGVDL